jgi:heptose I phosphotransferase
VEHFLSLSGVIVSGHPERHVSRIQLSDDGRSFTAYLKREQRVSWKVRLTSALAGFGLVSRSVREARVLQALHRESIGCPEWLAVGEDSRGRAFLLVRAIDNGVDLACYLRGQLTTDHRCRLARDLGAAIARIHEAGLVHPDLYAKHILISPADGRVYFLDWQRSQRIRLVPWRRRCRDLAALHATVADEIARPRERLLCLLAYMRGDCAEGKKTGSFNGAAVRAATASIEAASHRLLRRRHIREKRQPPLDRGAQEWIKVDGEALCVTSAFCEAWPSGTPDWLALDRQPLDSGSNVARRWVALSPQHQTLLVRRRSRRPIAWLWAWLNRRGFASVEQQQAALLFRLQRHAVPAPRVLAMGQRSGFLGRQESFLLTQPVADTVPLDVWLSQQGRQRHSQTLAMRRWRLLHEAGTVLHRMHDAGCFFDRRQTSLPLAVCDAAEGTPQVVLASADEVCLRRQGVPEVEQRDLAFVKKTLAAAGCDDEDLRRFDAGYVASALVEEMALGFGNDSAMAAAPIVSPVDATILSPDGGAPVASMWQCLLHGVRRVLHRPDWVEFVGIDWADRVMDVAVTDRFHAKQGRSTCRWVLEKPAAGDGGPRRLVVYLKRHLEMSWLQRLMALVWPRGCWSPAMQECRHLEWARQQGVPVPDVVAAAEFIGPWGRVRSCLAVEELPDMLPLNEAVPLAASRLSPTDFRIWKRTLVAEMARLSRMLHDRRCFHKDLYLCHFYIVRQDIATLPNWRGRVSLIDLHRLAYHRWTWWLWQIKDLAQLLYSSEVDGVDVRDRLAFWREYSELGTSPRYDLFLRRWVLFKWRRYRKHNLRRKKRLQNL